MRPPSVVTATWKGEQRFDVSRNGAAVSSRIDAKGATGPGPVDMLLGALAACAAVDALEILAKRRTPAQRLTAKAIGDRADAVPARVTRVVLEYQIDGPGIDREAAERAVYLGVSKYCSVRNSLDPHMPILVSVTLNGEPGSEHIVSGDGQSTDGSRE
jgi:putative redox protein